MCNCIDAEAPIHDDALPETDSSEDIAPPGEDRVNMRVGGGAVWLYPGLMAIGAVASVWLVLARRLLRLPRPPAPGPGGLDSRELTAALVLLLFFAGMYLAQPLGAGLLAAVTKPPDAVRQAYVGGVISPETVRLGVVLRSGGYLAAGLVIAAWLMVRPRMGAGGATGQPLDSSLIARTDQSAPVPRRMVRAAAVGFIGLLLIWPLLHWVSFIGAGVQTWLTGRSPDVLAHDALRMLTDPAAGPWRFGAMALVIVGAPIVEEAAYRGMLQPALTTLLRSRWWAIVVTSVIFVAPHAAVVAPHALPTLFALSLGFGLARERGGGVLAPIVMHAAFNGANVALALTVG